MDSQDVNHQEPVVTVTAVAVTGRDEAPTTATVTAVVVPVRDSQGSVPVYNHCVPSPPQAFHTMSVPTMDANVQHVNIPTVQTNPPRSQPPAAVDGVAPLPPGGGAGEQKLEDVDLCSPAYMEIVKRTLTEASSFWMHPILYRDTATVKEVIEFLKEKNLSPDDKNQSLLIVKKLLQNDVLHMHGSWNVDEVNSLELSRALKIGRRFISASAKTLYEEQESFIARSKSCPEPGSARVSKRGVTNPIILNTAKTLHRGTSAGLMDRLSRATRRIFVSNPTNEQVATIVHSSIQESIFLQHGYPNVPVEELQIHDMFAIDRTMRERAKPLDPGVIALKNKVMNKEIYEPGLRSNYSPSVFRALRRDVFKISDDFYVNSLLDESLEVVAFGGGASGAMFLRSKSNHFIVKGITKSEARTLRSILPHYVDHCKNNPETLLPKIYGLIKVQIGVRPQDIIRLMICNNVFDTVLSVDVKFDLKGSTANRFVSQEQRLHYQNKHGANKLPTLKDLNLKGKMSVSTDMKHALLRQIKLDSGFLNRMKIMDYSLLLGVHESEPAGGVIPEPQAYCSRFEKCFGGIAAEPMRAIYFVGIIDMLQQYTAGKKVERFLKTKILKGATAAEQAAKRPFFSSRKFRIERHACLGCKSNNSIMVPLNDVEGVHIFEFVCGNCGLQQDYISRSKKASDRNISAVDPGTYSKRFIDFVEGKLVATPEHLAPGEAIGFQPYLKMSRGSSHGSQRGGIGGRGVRQAPPGGAGQPHPQQQQRMTPQQQRQMMRLVVAIPAGISPGMPFVVRTQEGRNHTVTCPTGCFPGMKVQVNVPIG
jgi:hypothetical protein